MLRVYLFHERRLRMSSALAAEPIDLYPGQIEAGSRLARFLRSSQCPKCDRNHWVLHLESGPRQDSPRY